MPYGAFCTLPEYKDLEAFLHVSEVAPRWIKNIHDFISEGQRYVVRSTMWTGRRTRSTSP